MTKEFVTYEQAVALKELGFDEPCFGYHVIQNYYSEKIGDFKTVNLTQGYVGYGSYSALNSRPHRMLAPLYQQAFRWFRENYKLHSFIGYTSYHMFDKGGFMYLIDILDPHKALNNDFTFKSHEEAEEACLDKLIEICKNK